MNIHLLQITEEQVKYSKMRKSTQSQSAKKSRQLNLVKSATNEYVHSFNENCKPQTLQQRMDAPGCCMKSALPDDSVH